MCDVSFVQLSACHFSCVTCNGPSAHHCLSCGSASFLAVASNGSSACYRAFMTLRVDVVVVFEFFLPIIYTCKFAFNFSACSFPSSGYSLVDCPTCAVLPVSGINMSWSLQCTSCPQHYELLQGGPSIGQYCSPLASTLAWSDCCVTFARVNLIITRLMYFLV